MEDRSIWLPAGLESPGLEPDDRASQRAEPGSGKRSNPGPKAAGEQGPYDQQHPESKRGIAKPDPTEGGKATGSEPPAESKAQKPAPKPVAAEGAKPEAKPEAKPIAKPEAKPTAKPKAKQPAQQPQAPSGRSDVDAMGQEKHRQVVGQRYGASRSRQLAYYGIFIAFVIGAYIGLKAAADQLDKAPAHDRDQAPWSKPNAPQGPLGGFEPEEPGQKGPARFQ